MKITSFLMASTVGLLLFVAFPFLIIQLSHFLGIYFFESPLFDVFGIMLIFIGTGVFLYCSGIFKKFGRGTPVPFDPPKKMVQQGLYRYVRNPMYIAGFIAIIGETLFFGTALLLAYAIIFIIGAHLFLVIYEEKDLKNRFGDGYSKLKTKLRV